MKLHTSSPAAGACVHTVHSTALVAGVTSSCQGEDCSIVGSSIQYKPHRLQAWQHQQWSSIGLEYFTGNSCLVYR